MTSFKKYFYMIVKRMNNEERLIYCNLLKKYSANKPYICDVKTGKHSWLEQ